VRPFSGLVRNDTFDRPVVIRKGSVFVTAGTDRRSSGTHYTPRSLTEPIVQYTLEPLVYLGPAEGKPKEEWALRPARELLDLKICDMACGSGAFLVQACRYLSERLVEAWEVASGEWRVVKSVTNGEEKTTMTIRHYRELKVWQTAMDLAESCYQVTKAFPKSETFGLMGQIRRAAVSIPANIAEGQGRRHTKEFLNHLSMARGSLMELETHLILGQRVGLVEKSDLDRLLTLSDQISRMLSGLRKTLESRL